MLFAFDTEMMFGADGPELLAFRTADEEPTWRFMAQSPIAAVALAGSSAIALAQDGTVGWFDTRSGLPRASTATAPYPRDIAADAWGGVIVLHPQSATLLDARGARALAVPAAAPLSTAGFALGSRLVAVGTEDGTVHLFDSDTGRLGVSHRVGPAPIRGVVGCGAARWLVTAGDAVYDVSDSSIKRVTGLKDKTLGAVVYDPSVNVIGLQLSANEAVFLDATTLVTKLSATYVDRVIVGLGVVGRHGYTIGLDHGDANRFDLRTGGTCRTEPHPGRPRRSWMLAVGH